MPESLNRYIYAFSQPASVTDPSGNFGLAEFGAANIALGSLGSVAATGNSTVGPIKEEADLRYQMLSLGFRASRMIRGYVNVVGNKVAIDLSVSPIDSDSASDREAAALFKESVQSHWTTSDASVARKSYSISTNLKDASWVSSFLDLGVVWVRAGSKSECAGLNAAHVSGTTQVVMCGTAGISTGAHEFGHVLGFPDISDAGSDTCEPGEFPDDIMSCSGKREVKWQHIKRLQKSYGR